MSKSPYPLACDQYHPPPDLASHAPHTATTQSTPEASTLTHQKESFAITV